MSVWRDMGFRADGTPFGVEPETFLFTAYYHFWDRLRRACWEDWTRALPYFDFNFRRKRGDGGRYEFEKWQKLGEYLSFPADTFPAQGAFARPVPASYWQTAPEWSAIFALTEGDILGEPVVPCPYSSPFRDVMSPDWPEQRLRLIQLMRYAVVPLDITLTVNAEGGASLEFHEDHIDGGYIDFGTSGSHIGESWVEKIAITFPAYWAQAGTCRIGIDGETGKPVGISWIDGKTWSYQHTGAPAEQSLSIYGAVDLATHPDFAQYFDI